MRTIHTLSILAAGVALSACQNLVRPEMTSLANGLGAQPNPALNMPVTIPQPATPQHGSLWVPGSKQFFKDSRAHQVGDIVTIIVQESATAKVEAKTDASRTHQQRAGLLDFLNLEGKLTSRGIPLGPTNLINSTSDRDFQGDGKTDRKDSLTASIAAVVTQVMPNGLLVIQGQREVLVNYEKQVMTLQGLIRPEDITSQNTIGSGKIAEARIAYAGRGVIDDAQTPQYGVRWIDKILPF
ncbi:MAG: flagellar basal body L-ring protein FlgH [Alphaproteobacteria bacterium]|nr:MAG: flagellar basal body L-ring protein FlgH [Alphaproteobacteria bacterium]